MCGRPIPLELCVAAPEGSGVPAGVHRYDPLEHALVRVGPAPRAGAPVIAVTGIPWRTGWRYRERGYRHIYWDAGTALAQLVAAADSAGITARLYTRFPDATVAVLVGAAGSGRLARRRRARHRAGWTGGRGRGRRCPPGVPLVTAAQRAGEHDGLGAPWASGAPASTPARSAKAVGRSCSRAEASVAWTRPGRRLAIFCAPACRARCAESSCRAGDVGGPGGGAGNAGSPAGALVVGDDVAAFEHAGDLVLGSAAPGLGQDDGGHERADAGGGGFVVQGEEVGVAPFGGEQGAGVVDDGRHQLAARWGSLSSSPVSVRNWRARRRDSAVSGPCSCSYSAISSRAAARPAACRAAARAFSVAASASQAETGLPSPAAADLMVSSTSAGTEIESFRAVMRPC